MTDTTPPTHDVFNFVDGEWTNAGEAIPIDNPYSGDRIAIAHASDAAQVGRAVHALAAAAPIEASAIAGVLRRTVEVVNARRAEFVRTLGQEAGFTAADADGELERGFVTLELSAHVALSLRGEMVSLAASPGNHDRIAYTLLQPLGVVAAITPFNSPFNIVLHKIAPALAARNSVILKPSERTPITAALLVEAMLDAGLPRDRVALVNGGAGTVEALLDSPDVAFYAFTGSSRVGEIVARGAGIRGSQLELGSIASTIVCRDADLDAAIPKIARAAFRKAGQVCTSVQRLIVHRDVIDDVAERLADAATQLTVGDPLAPSTDVGPVVTRADATRIQSWIDEAVAAGARLLAGGTSSGSLVEPTVLLEPTRQSRVMCEEVFGPVVSIVPFDHLDEALSLANDTEYGLSAGIFTARVDEALAAAERLDFGSVHINETSSSRLDGMPFGGLKGSGRGKEGPEWAARAMSKEKLVSVSR